MRKTYLAYVTFFALIAGAIGPICVALAEHWWQLPVDQFLPGGYILFLPPTVLVAASYFAVTLRYRNSVGFGVKVIALALVLVGGIFGLVASIPFICAIAGQCL